MRIACQPLRDVLIVGGGAALVRAVREEPGHRDGRGGGAKEEVFVSLLGHGLCLARGGQAQLW